MYKIIASMMVCLLVELLHASVYNLKDLHVAGAPWATPYLQRDLDPWVYMDFDESMQTARYENALHLTTRVIGIDGQLLYRSFKGLYNKNNLSVIRPSKKLHIPKIIHQVWLGGDVPDCFKEYIKSWIEYHLDGWRYMLWTDKEIAKFPLYNSVLYNQTDSVGVKADIIKMEVVYQYGGVCIDTDFECLRPLDILHYTYDFYVGIQPLDSQFFQLANGIIGACPGHPILKHCIETVADDWHEKGAPKKTGPIHLTKSFYLMSDMTGMVDIAFPATYLYPLGCQETSCQKERWLQQGAFGVHWWAKSWMPATYRPNQFKAIHNDESTKSWNS